MQARATVLEMVKKCGGKDGGVGGGRVAQLPIPNHIDDGKDECGGAADARPVVIKAHLPDGLESSCLVLLFFGDCRIVSDALEDDKGLFVRLEVVTAGDIIPQRLCFA